MATNVITLRIQRRFATLTLALERAAAVFAVKADDSKNMVVITTPAGRKSRKKFAAAA